MTGRPFCDSLGCVVSQDGEEVRLCRDCHSSSVELVQAAVRFEELGTETFSESLSRLRVRILGSVALSVHERFVLALPSPPLFGWGS